MNTDELASTERLQLENANSSVCVVDRKLMGVRPLGIRVLSGIAIATGLALPSLAQNSEGFYARGYDLGQKLWELDPQSGAIFRQIPYTPGFLSETAMAHNGERLIIKGNTNWLEDRLVRAHPADGGRVEYSPMGSPWRLTAVDFDSVAREMRGICQDNQGATGDYGCRFDSATGQVTMLAVITPSLYGITAMAINAAGVAYVATSPGPKLYVVDLPSGLSTYVGNLSVPTSIAYDLAFDGSGKLWASLYDVHTGADTGIYTVDLTTFAATRILALQSPYTGIAFGRKSATQSYCGGKTSSISCMPTLSADGFASPTATLGFTIHADNLNNNRAGLLFYTAAGRASIPFQGGLLCISTPISRSSAANTGGAPAPALDCSGSWSVDYNAMIWAKYGGLQASNVASQPPFTLPGTAIQCQWWGRDPGFAAPFNSMLSGGLEFILAP